MSHSHRRDLRARGGRVLLDQLIARSAEEVYRLYRDDFFSLCQAIRAHTSLLDSHRLGSSESFCSIHRVLSGLRLLSEYRYRFHRSIDLLPDQRRLPLAVQWLGVVRHLIEPYPLPEFLSYHWLTSASDSWGCVAHLKLADGISLRKIALPDETFANKVVARQYMGAPADASPEGAIRFAQVMALSHQARRAPSISHARFAMKWIRFVEDVDGQAFWDGLLQWIERERPAIDLLQRLCCDLVAVRHRSAAEEFGFGYPDRAIDPHIDITSWSLKRAKQFLANWQEDYMASFADQVRRGPARYRPWQKAAIPDATFSVSDGRSVHFVQLNTPYQLSVEGRKQSHCVGSYASICRRGRSAVFSMRMVTDQKIQHRLTIEVHLGRGEVKTALGKANRDPTVEEWAWVRQWADQNYLKLW